MIPVLATYGFGAGPRLPSAKHSVHLLDTNTEKISRIVDWPEWVPPAEMLKRQPELPLKMTGGLNNPLGVKALYLGDSLYRIHGTNDAKSIGRAASSGCFRMLNEHVMHLSSLVQIGTPVKVVKNWPSTSATHDLRAAERACSVEIPTSRR
jgi:lipoprotein-anchoring transpeptidase ErfK/SrfK